MKQETSILVLKEIMENDFCKKIIEEIKSNISKII
jgi:hypothetical protein